MKIEKVHISTLKSGDTVLHNGCERTLCKNNIKHDSFMGYSIFGDSYRFGTLLVNKIIKKKNKKMYYISELGLLNNMVRQ